MRLLPLTSLTGTLGIWSSWPWLERSVAGRRLGQSESSGIGIFRIQKTVAYHHIEVSLFQCIQFCFIRLRLERTQHYVEAFVERCNGDVVVSASTREWAIKRHLYSPKGVTACKNLGHVMAQRCLEAGINFVNFKAIIPWEHRCDSIQEFEKAMKEGGVVLYEPRRIYG
uniref:Large ribosomal subunit protein uL18m n=1 Tax=Apteryx owenii TaxID=8824 RepID=A0A8B9SD74_APTOW